MNPIATWLLPVLLIPAAALLLTSVTARLGSLQQEFHHLITDEDCESCRALADKLLYRAHLLARAVTLLYTGAGLFALSALIGGLRLAMHSLPETLYHLMTMLGVLAIVAACVCLILDSRMTLLVFTHRRETVRKKVEAGS